jgi:hypothetical protein
MRVLIAIVSIALGIVALGIASVTAATAADLPVVSGYSAIGVGQRSEPLVVYADQPGVYVRAYWQTPWHNHHYYPATGERPDIGRDEDLSAPSKPSKSPATFRRSWSNASAFPVERPRLVARDRAGEPPSEPSQSEPYLPPLK